MVIIKKITDGYVEQTFDDNAVCISQKFVAIDQVEYEDKDGNPVSSVISQEFQKREKYQPFGMLQPGLDYYVVSLIGCVCPEIDDGPFATEAEAEQHMNKLIKEHGQGQNTFFTISVTKGAEINL